GPRAREACKRHASHGVGHETCMLAVVSRTSRSSMRPLDRLADRCGIEPEFRDASGQLRRPSAAAKRRLLAAMGVRASGSADAERALTEIEQADWARPLSVTVVR